MPVVDVHTHLGVRGYRQVRCLADKARIKHMTVAYSDGMPDKSDRYIPYEYGECMFATTGRKGIEQIVGKGKPMPTSRPRLPATTTWLSSYSTACGGTPTTMVRSRGAVSGTRIACVQFLLLHRDTRTQCGMSSLPRGSRVMKRHL